MNRRVWRGLRGWLTAGTMTFGIACGDSRPTGTFFTHRSKYFVYHTRQSEPLCPTLLARLDEHVELIFSQIDREHDFDEDEPFHYYRFDDRADFTESSGCDVPEGLAGCARDDLALSTRPMHAHELVHAYVFRAWGRHSVGLLAEGVASALSCEPFYPVQPNQTPREVLSSLISSLDWKELLHVRGDTSAGYGATAFFVSYLAELHGWPGIAELYRRIPPNADVATFEREFLDVFSVPMDQVWSDVLDQPGGATCKMDWPCIATTLEPGSAAVPDCDEQFHRRIELVQSGGLELAVSGSDSALRLLDCGTPTPSVYEFSGGQGTPAGIHWASLPPGSYTLFPGSGPLPSRVEFRSRLPSAWINAMCADATLVTLDPAGQTSVDFPTGTVPFDGPTSSDGSAWLRLDGDSRDYDVSTVDLLWTGVSPAGAIELCDACDTPDCTPLAMGEVVRVSISDTATVRMRNAFSFPAPSQAWGQVFFRPVPPE